MPAWPMSATHRASRLPSASSSGRRSATLVQSRAMSSTFGHLFRVTNFGESHGPAIGCVIDGCPPGLPLSAADLQPDLDRRKPGTSRHVTQRREPDEVEILSGVYEGVTTGTPDRAAHPQRGPAQQGLREPPRHVPAGARRLHLLAQVRPARSARRRSLVGAADGADGRRRRGGEEVAAGDARHAHSRLHGADRRGRHSLHELGRRRRQPVLRAGCGVGRRTRGVHGRAAQERRLGRRAAARHRERSSGRPRARRCTTSSTPTSRTR